jgi:hypothetical protein
MEPQRIPKQLLDDTNIGRLKLRWKDEPTLRRKGMARMIQNLVMTTTHNDVLVTAAA